MPKENTEYLLAKYHLNKHLHGRTSTLPIPVEIKHWRWRWIGHINRMEPSSITRVAMRWTPDGKRKRE